MSQTQIGISDMQCWVFRKAQQKWRISPQECAGLFRQFDLFGYIRDCYDVFHLSSYDHALCDIEEILQKGGVQL